MNFINVFSGFLVPSNYRYFYTESIGCPIANTTQAYLWCWNVIPDCRRVYWYAIITVIETIILMIVFLLIAKEYLKAKKLAKKQKNA